MKRFHRGRDIGCLPLPPYHWSCMSDQLLMWHNVAYSIYYAQHQVSAICGMREHIVAGVNILKVCANITLLLTWRRADIKVIARQALSTTVCDKLLNAKATLWEEHKQSRCLPSWLSPDLKKKYAKSDVLTMKMIRIIQKLHLFNMKGQIFIQFCYFVSLIRFAHFMIMLGEEHPSLPPLTASHWFFIIQIF